MIFMTNLSWKQIDVVFGQIQVYQFLLRKEFKIMLDELDWMDDITRKKAQVKVDKMTPHIGYAKEILDNNLINEFYEGKYINLSEEVKEN